MSLKRSGGSTPGLGSAADGWGPWIDVDTGVGFENSWVNFGGEQDGEYRKHFDGTVELRGLVKSGTVDPVTGVIFTLPTGYRPPYTQINAVVSNSAFGYCRIDANGEVLASQGSNIWFALDTIFFDSTGGS